MLYKRIKLPFAELNELEPILYFKNVFIHYYLIHKKHEDRLNEKIKDGFLEIDKKFFSLNKILENLSYLPKYLKEGKAEFCAGGLINHNFFFNQLMKPSEE